MRRWRSIAAIVAVTVICGLSACSDREMGSRQRRLHVMATLFPLYDIASAVGGDRADVVLLLPPGMEPHSFEPRPGDISAMERSDIFIYTNRYMEPWANDILKSMGDREFLVVDAGRGLHFIHGQGAAEPKSGDVSARGYIGARGFDPHVWLDLGNAMLMVETVRDAFMSKDPSHRDEYRENARRYLERLITLDRQYRDGLASCRNKVIVDGGHATFGYLAARYGLRYIAAGGMSPDAEPSAAELARISRLVRSERLPVIFTEQLLAPRIAETLSRETGASVLYLRGAHTVTRQELQGKVTFIALMEKNLEQLRTGLQCR